MDFKAVIGTLAMLAFLALGLVQLVIGYHGLDVQFGSPWALIGAILAFLRFTPPIIVGVYFGAIDLWGVASYRCGDLCSARVAATDSRDYWSCAG